MQKTKNFQQDIKNMQIIRDNFYRAGFLKAGQQVQQDIWRLLDEDLKTSR